MSTINPGIGRLLAGCGGALLIASLSLPWSETSSVTQSGWKTLSVLDVFFLITGVCGLAAAVTGGRFGFFRPDLSLNGMTDIFGVITGILIGWLILFEFPSGANREVGVYLALVGAIAIATGAGAFRVRSLFPPSRCGALPLVRELNQISRCRSPRTQDGDPLPSTPHTPRPDLDAQVGVIAPTERRPAHGSKRVQ